MLDKRKFYINGEWVDPLKKDDFEVINPCNEDPFAILSLGSKEIVKKNMRWLLLLILKNSHFLFVSQFLYFSPLLSQRI